MNAIYPMEQKPIAPPSYEQAVYHAQSQVINPSVGIYSPENNVLQNPIPQTVMYSPGPSPYSAMPIGTSMLITSQSLLYGDVPVHCLCPHCRHPILTRLEKKTGLVAWLACGGIVLFGGWLGCCLIPFCIDGLKDTEHYCPHCSILLATRRRL